MILIRLVLNHHMLTRSVYVSFWTQDDISTLDSCDIAPEPCFHPAKPPLVSVSVLVTARGVVSTKRLDDGRNLQSEHCFSFLLTLGS